MTPVSFDLGVIAVLAFTAWRGARKGLVWQLAWIAALLLCFAVSGSISPTIARAIPVDAPLDHWIAMFAIYVGAVFVTFWMARKISDWMEKHRFKEFDRHFGAIFGCVKGIIFALTVTFFLVTLSADARKIVLNSKSGYAAALLMNRLHPVLPKEFHESMEAYIHQLDEAAGEAPLRHSGDGANGAAGNSKTTPQSASNTVGPGAAEIPSAVVGLDSKLRDLLQKIAAIHSQIPEDQSAMVARMKTALDGLPDAVSVAVLSDLYADLSQSGPDPDRQTDQGTGLDTRIRRQLEAARISLDGLGSALRKRLLESEMP